MSIALEAPAPASNGFVAQSIYAAVMLGEEHAAVWLGRSARGVTYFQVQGEYDAAPLHVAHDPRRVYTRPLGPWWCDCADLGAWGLPCEHIGAAAHLSGLYVANHQALQAALAAGMTAAYARHPIGRYDGREWLTVADSPARTWHTTRVLLDDARRVAWGCEACHAAACRHVGAALFWASARRARIARQKASEQQGATR